MTPKSPWRYPGGKSRLAERLLGYLPETFNGFVEPFVGGGGFTLPALGRIVPGTPVELNDADPRVAAWWELTATGSEAEFERLIGLLESYEPTVKSFFKIREKALTSGRLSDRGFSAIATNRTAYSGILNAGPIGGTGQKSEYAVGCRYNAKKMVTEHRAVREALADFDVRVSNRDFREFLSEANTDSFTYLDPPYINPGRLLYPTFFSRDDHEDLAKWVLEKRDGGWAISYDNDPWVYETYSEAKVVEIPARYSVRSPNQTTELLVVPA